MDINFNVVWGDLGREAALSSFTSCTVKSYCGPQQALLEKNAFYWGYPSVQRSRVGQVSHEMWFYNTRNEHKAELIPLNTKADCNL